MASQAESKITTDHDEIRRWAEERGGEPACVRGTGGKGDIGMIRIDFPGFSGEDSLEHISWEDWFAKFDESGLALLHQEHTAGGAQSNFNKLVSRETAEAASSAKHRSSSGSRAKSKPAKKTAGKKTAARKSASTSGSANARKASASKGKSTAKKTTAKKSSAKKSASRSRSR